MGKLVAILESSGDGKTTSTIINPDGTFDLKNYQGMNPKSHFILNLDRKTLPFPGKMWSEDLKNYLEPVDFTGIKTALQWISKQDHIKSVSIDTINIYLAMKEYNGCYQVNRTTMTGISQHGLPFLPITANSSPAAMIPRYMKRSNGLRPRPARASGRT